MVIVNIKKEDSKKAFKKEAVFKVPKIKGYPTIRIEKGCDFQRNTNFSYSSQPLFSLILPSILRLLRMLKPISHNSFVYLTMSYTSILLNLISSVLYISYMVSSIVSIYLSAVEILYFYQFPLLLF